MDTYFDRELFLISLSSLIYSWEKNELALLIAMLYFLIIVFKKQLLNEYLCVCVYTSFH